MNSKRTVNISNLNRTTLPEHGFDPEFHPALLVIAFLVITSNLLVMVLFSTNEKLRKGGRLLLLSLAISDITAGLVTIPMQIGCEVTFSLALCMSAGSLNRFLAISTVYHILSITFETYYAILRPVEHRVNIEKRKILAIVLSIWFGALVIALTPVFLAIGVLKNVSDIPDNDFLRKLSIYEIFVITFGFLLPLTLMIFAHARMFSKIIHALNVIRRRGSPSHKPSNTRKNKYKTAILFAALLLVFTACWLFWFAVTLLKFTFNLRHPFPKWALDTLTLVRYSTSFINPMLYTFFRPDFYTAFLSLFQRRSGRTPSITLTYLLSGSHRNKRDSQTTTTLFRESSTVPTGNANAQQCSSSKLFEKDTKI